MKWDDTWYRELSPEMKCLWQFLCDRCDNAGYWKIDVGAARFYIGCDIPDQEDCFAIMNNGKDRIAVDGEYWHILDFVHFQYRELVDNNPFHRSIKQLIDKHLRHYQGTTKGLRSTIGKGKGEGKVLIEYSKEFNDFWDKYTGPNKTANAKGPCFETWKTLSDTDRAGAVSRLPLYIANASEPKFIAKPSRYLNEKLWTGDFKKPQPKSTCPQL